MIVAWYVFNCHNFAMVRYIKLKIVCCNCKIITLIISCSSLQVLSPLETNLNKVLVKSIN